MSGTITSRMLIGLKILSELKVGESMLSGEYRRRYNEIAARKNMPLLTSHDLPKTIRAMQRAGLATRSPKGRPNNPFKITPTLDGMDVLDGMREVLE